MTKLFILLLGLGVFVSSSSYAWGPMWYEGMGQNNQGFQPFETEENMKMRNDLYNRYLTNRDMINYQNYSAHNALTEMEYDKIQRRARDFRADRDYLNYDQQYNLDKKRWEMQQRAYDKAQPSLTRSRTKTLEFNGKMDMMDSMIERSALSDDFRYQMHMTGAARKVMGYRAFKGLITPPRDPFMPPMY